MELVVALRARWWVVLADSKILYMFGVIGVASVRYGLITNGFSSRRNVWLGLSIYSRGFPEEAGSGMKEERTNPLASLVLEVRHSPGRISE